MRSNTQTVSHETDEIIRERDQPIPRQYAQTIDHENRASSKTREDIQEPNRYKRNGSRGELSQKMATVASDSPSRGSLQDVNTRKYVPGQI